MKSRFSTLLYGAVLFIFAVGSIEPVSAQSYLDSFNGPTLNSFWTQTTKSGTISFENQTVHSASDALAFTSTATTLDKNLFLTHNFAQPVYGKTSIWLFDTGAGVASSNYAELNVNGGGTQLASVYTFDYGFPGGGPGSGADYDINTPGVVKTESTGLSRTQAWHQFSIDSEPDSFQMAVDGTMVYSGTGGQPFDQIEIGTQGPYWRPAYTYYFDDFRFVASVPEATPLTQVLALGFITIGMLSMRRKRLRSGN